MGDYLDDEHDSGYLAELGVRLRSLRRQRHQSLQDVEAASDHEFKASVLGAYERGERAISVPRLQRLARVYRVPVDQMVPSDEPGTAPPTGDERDVDPAAGPRHTQRDHRPVTIDLAALTQLGEHKGEMLARYLRTIEVQRGDTTAASSPSGATTSQPSPASSAATPIRYPAGSTTSASAVSPDPVPHPTVQPPAGPR